MIVVIIDKASLAHLKKETQNRARYTHLHVPYEKSTIGVLHLNIFT